MTEADWAYLAGFIDGDGCISAHTNKDRSRWHPKLSMSQSDHVFALELYERYGVGRFRLQKVSGGRIAARWAIYNGRDLSSVLTNVLPYLVLKKGQAESALRLLQDRTNSDAAGELIQLKTHRKLDRK
jgi:LAGLIDADG endonuclease